MILQINNDHQRFRKIVKGKIREDLRKFLTRGELLGRGGKQYISIPVRGIDLPHFRYGDNNDSGVGKGEGKPGDSVSGEGGLGPGGTEEGHHILEVDVSLEELAEILGEELQLPRIKPKGGPARTCSMIPSVAAGTCWAHWPTCIGRTLPASSDRTSTPRRCPLPRAIWGC